MGIAAPRASCLFLYHSEVSPVHRLTGSLGVRENRQDLRKRSEGSSIGVHTPPRIP